MPYFPATPNIINGTTTMISVAQVHQDAPTAIISLSWALIVIPCLFLVAAFAWIMYNFSTPSEFHSDNDFSHTDTIEEQVFSDDHEKETLLDAFNQSQSHSNASSASTDSNSAWKINAKFSTTSRGGSVYTSYPDLNHTRSPKSKRSSLNLQAKSNRSVGSKAAKVQASNWHSMLHHLENLDPIDRQELQRSSSTASDTRKSD
ncbi:uncharacterized protein MEPE_04121 [Melanopsichium pennsylvanicum]|uniref:Uncharacterized protein n=2 Tax=Melanopsichium pennsylvanicum TaxID=63383 RepID=A0AAJ5C639_9BASI|nr:putative protein [Melanopsichium pennsylvanicum 4]SNX85412.1 uncharacterized protein MEPE_04121 [Melanopsichium pennsylvanicum]